MMHRIGIVGASGYSGSVAARIAFAHPALELAFATSDQLAGKPASDRLGVRTDLAFVPNAEASQRGLEVRAVLLCTPAEVSATLAPKLADAGVLVIDVSGAFRLESSDDYARWYGFDHPSAAWLARAHYGLPELFGPPPAGTTLVANPGCYPTATLLGLAPLVRAGLVEDQGIVVDAKSGVTGAGRQGKEELSFAEVNEDLRAYKVLAHQHAPEIARHLGRARGSGPLRTTFVPHLLPVSRGLLATAYARPRPGATAARVRECLADTYRGTAFVDVVAPGEVTLHAVAGTNRARVAATADDDVVVAFGAIDNLVKGAAGQAVQNLNLALGLDEGAGLTTLARFAP